MTENEFVMPGCIGDLLAKRDELKRRVNVGELTAAAYKKNLDKILCDLSEAKNKRQQKSDLANYLDELLSNLDARVSALSSSNAERDVMIEQLQSLLNLDSNSLLTDKENLKILEQESLSLASACSDSPWIPEKQEFIQEYKNELAKLTSVTQEMEAMHLKIEDRKRIIDGHSVQPFRNFCVHDLASFYSQTHRMKALWKLEVIKKAQLEAKIGEQGPSQNDLSFFLNQHEIDVHLINTETQIDSTTHDVEPEQLNPLKSIIVVKPKQNEEVSMEDENREHGLNVPVQETLTAPVMNNSIQIVDYEDSDASTPVKWNQIVTTKQVQDNAMEESVPEQRIENSAERSMMEQQSQSKDQFTSQVEFSFAGDGILSSANIMDDIQENGEEDFFALMHSISGGGDENNQAGFFDMFAGEPKGKESGGKAGESFTFNFGNASMNDSVGFDGGSGQKTFF